MDIAGMIGRLLAPILIPIIREALHGFFTDTAEVGGFNPDLQRLWDDGVRNAGNIRPAGICGGDNWMDEAGSGCSTGRDGKAGPLGGRSATGDDGEGSKTGGEGE